VLLMTDLTLNVLPYATSLVNFIITSKDNTKTEQMKR